MMTICKTAKYCLIGIFGGIQTENNANNEAISLDEGYQALEKALIYVKQLPFPFASENYTSGSITTDRVF